MSDEIAPRPFRFTSLRLVRDEQIEHTLLRPATRQRLNNQLDRAFRNRYGAEQGLRVVVRVATLELLRSGATRAQIKHTLTEVVSSHPANGDSRSSLLTGQSRGTSLTTMILSWAAGIEENSELQT
jgi:hypothetical protein